jgi:hypothetical protein
VIAVEDDPNYAKRFPECWTCNGWRTPPPESDDGIKAICGRTRSHRYGELTKPGETCNLYGPLPAGVWAEGRKKVLEKELSE